MPTNSERYAEFLARLCILSLQANRPDAALIADLVGQRLRNFAFNDATKKMLLSPELKTRPMDRIQ
jgi:hypothetical protein